MLFANPMTNPPSITLPLNVTGRYALYLGIYYGGYSGALTDRILRVKLTGDAVYSRIGRESFQPKKDGHYPEKELKWSDIAQAFWKCADLTGKAIQFARPTRGEFAETDTNIAYVKLVPLTQTEIEKAGKDAPRTHTRRLIANYDGGNIGQWGLSTLDDIREELECLRDSDFDIALYGVAYGPICFYPSKVGEFIRADLFAPSHHQYTSQAIHRLWGAKIDLFRAAVEMVHEVNVKLLPQIRFEATQLPPQHEPR